MFYSIARSALFRMEPETAHEVTFRCLEPLHACGLLGLFAPARVSAPVRLFGLEFANSVGLAAGLDKNGAHIDVLAALGFGYIEIGTVTPRPQPGNPKPRMFRVPEARALINRLGFNNLGVDALVENVRRAKYRGVLGVNIGKNFDTPNEQAADDYLTCLEKVYELASYVTINISSPNTKNLRLLQDINTLDPLLEKLKTAQQRLAAAHGRYVPLLLKIAPDLDESHVIEIGELLRRNGIDGAIATNTTISREAVSGLPHGNETGGLSGAPLKDASTHVLRLLRIAVGPNFPLIGAGGIFSAADAQEKILAGANLVQLYTGFIYRGPALVRECATALAQN